METPKSQVVIVLIVKNEAPYLLEWIAYHRAIGVDRFLIYNNESTDETLKILRSLEQAGIVTYIEWLSKPECNNQMEAYRDACQRLDGKCEWVAIIDCDEFIVPIQDDDLPSFLSRYEDVAGIAINWKIFGSSGHLSKVEGLVMERFTRCASSDFHIHQRFKTISRLKFLKDVGIHMCEFEKDQTYCYADRVLTPKLRLGYGPHITYDCIQLNHYFTKSKAEWDLKRARGRADLQIGSTQQMRPEQGFNIHDRNEQEDLAILRFLDRTHKEIKYLKKISQLDVVSTCILTQHDEIEILQLTPLIKYNQDLLVGANIELPKLETKVAPSSFRIAGWVLGRDSKAVAVQIICDGRVLCETSVDKARPDVAKAYPKFSEAQNSGFSALVSPIGMPNQSVILIQAVLENESCIPLNLIKYCQAEHVSTEKKIDRTLDWNQVLEQSSIRLYAGDLTKRAQNDGWIGVSQKKSDEHHIKHDLTKPLPIPDAVVDAFQSEDVFEHIHPSKLLAVTFPEIYRVLKPGGFIRMSLPDYRCDILLDRAWKDERGKPYYDPGPDGRGKSGPVDWSVAHRGHVWFPTYETLQALIELSPLRYCKAHWLHYYDTNGTPVMNPIDYSKGFIGRTPDHDPRVQNPRRPMSIAIDLYKV